MILATAVALAGCSKDQTTPGGGSTDPTITTSSPDTDTDSGIMDEKEDNIANTSFDRTISISWTDSEASVTGDEKGIVSVNGTAVEINNTSTSEKVKYELSGSCSNGSLKIYSGKKQALVFNGLSLTNPEGAAINNQCKKRCFVVVNGSNSLSDGASAAYTATGSEDLKAVFFSEGQLCFSGSGTLSVTALNSQSKNGIATDDYVFLNGPTLKITAGSGAGHGLRGKDAVTVNKGALDINVSADMKKGITSDSLVVFNGGTAVITATGGTAYDSEDSEPDYKASAGIKVDQVFKMNGGTLTINNSGQGGKGISGDGIAYFNGGTVRINVTGKNYGTSSEGPGGPGGGPGGGGGYHRVSTRATNEVVDDYVQAKAIKFDGDIHVNGGTIVATSDYSECIESKGTLSITAGEIYAYSKADDAINASGDLSVTGGCVCVMSEGNDALDANGNLVLSGGVIYAVCTAGNPEVALDADEQHKLYIKPGVTVIAYGGLERGYSATQTVKTFSCTAGAWNALYGSDGFIAAFKAPSGKSSFSVSAPGLSKGYKGVSVNEDALLCEGHLAVSGISGGTASSL